MKFFTLKTVILFLFLFNTANAYTQAAVYPAPKDVPPSGDYKVFIDGKEAFVYASPVPAAYCGFEISGQTTITIKTSRDIKWVDIRPLSANIKPVFKDSTITFSINQPQQLSIELNGSIKNPLFIFANPPETNKPSKTDKNVLFFEAGKIHYPGIIYVKSNQTVYIEGGAVVVGVIKAVAEKNITISGYGVLDGSYNNRFDEALIKAKALDKLGREENHFYQRFIELINCENVIIENVILHNSTSWQVVPVNCRKVHINNIKIISDQPSDDGIDVVHSKQVLIEHCFIRTKDDCIAIKAYMKRSAASQTDSVLVKAPDLYIKYEASQVQDDDSITIRKCVFWNALWGNGIEIGFELNGADVKNISFTDCDIIHVEAGAVFSIHNAGTSTVSHVLFDNIRVEDARQKLFDLAIFRSRYSEDGEKDEVEMRKQYWNSAWDGVLHVPAEKKAFHAAYRGHIKNIVFKNIQVVDGLFPFSVFYGFDDMHAVENVSIENLTVHGKKITVAADAKLYTENTANIKNF